MALHCPATLLLVGLPALPDHDVAGDDVLREVSQGAEFLRLSRVGAIYHSPDLASTACAGTAAAVLGLPSIVVPELDQPMGVDPSVKHRTSWAGEALQDIADVHRGESVLVFAPRPTFQGARIRMRPARRPDAIHARSAASTGSSASSAGGASESPSSGTTAVIEDAPPNQDMSVLHIAALAIGDDGWFLAPWPGA